MIRRLRRNLRFRFLGICLGIALGWTAAGLWQASTIAQPTPQPHTITDNAQPVEADHMLASADAMHDAATAEHDAHADRAAAPADHDSHDGHDAHAPAAATDHGAADHAADGSHGSDGKHPDAAQIAAGQLLPRAADGTPTLPGWFTIVIAAAAALFAAACIFGLIAHAMKATDPNIAAAQADAAAAHAAHTEHDHDHAHAPSTAH